MAKKKISNLPGINQSATRNAEREYKKSVISAEAMNACITPTIINPIEINHSAFRNSEIFKFNQFPGLYLITGFTPTAQLNLLRECLENYTLKPNVTNLDTHYHIPAAGLWNSFVRKPHVELKIRQCDSPDTIIYEESTDDPVKIDPPTSDRPYIKPVTFSDAIKKLRWTSLGFQYHWQTKEYHIDRKVLMPTLINDLTFAIISAILPFTNYTPSKWKAEAGIVNFYQYKDSLTAHQDRSENNMDAPLISFSLGNSCIFLMGTEDRQDKPSPILLKSGDILILSGESRRNYHGVPRILENTCPEYLLNSQDRHCSEFIRNSRINVNIRQVFSA